MFVLYGVLLDAQVLVVSEYKSKRNISYLYESKIYIEIPCTD